MTNRCGVIVNNGKTEHKQKKRKGKTRERAGVFKTPDGNSGVVILISQGDVGRERTPQGRPQDKI